MAKKPKNVDSIVKSTPSIVADKQRSSDEPLLSIIEPVSPPAVGTKSKKSKAKKVKVADAVDKPLFHVRHRKAIIVSVLTFIVLLLTSGLIVGGAYSYGEHYKDKVFPGVKVWGMDVGGKTVTEVQEAITAKTKAYTLTFKGPDQDYIATAEDLGVIYDSEAMLTKALAKGRSGDILADNFTRLYLLATKIDVSYWQDLIHAKGLAISPVFSVSNEKFDQYVTKVAENIKITPQDSQVNVSAGQIQLRPAIYGREVLVDNLKSQVRQSIDEFVTQEIVVQTVTVKPAIIDTAAQEVMIQAQSVMKRPVTLTYQGVDYRPNQETVASWISFIKNEGDTKYTLVVDTAKMKGYFDYLGTKINIYSIPRKIRVENMVNEIETQAGKDGLLVDQALLGRAISEQLPVQAAVSLNIPTYVSPFKTEYDRVIIADWDKYIDVNISTQTMTACERGGVNCRQWYVMTGKNSTPTPVGTWLVQSPAHSRNFWMSGLEGTPEYYRLWVPYSTWFKGGGYAIHSASWRNNDPSSSNGFGNQAYTWNGSHGCVNSPDEAAEYIYFWADTGTPVIVHY